MRDSPAWSDDELQVLSHHRQRTVLALTDIQQCHLSEYTEGQR